MDVLGDVHRASIHDVLVVQNVVVVDHSLSG